MRGRRSQGGRGVGMQYHPEPYFGSSSPTSHHHAAKTVLQNRVFIQNYLLILKPYLVKVHVLIKLSLKRDVTTPNYAGNLIFIKILLVQLELTLVSMAWKLITGEPTHFIIHCILSWVRKFQQKLYKVL